jgi:hypothetical protein
MMRVTALCAGLAALVLAVTPVAASPDDHRGGPLPWGQNDQQRPDWKHDGPNQGGNGNGNDNGNDNRSPWWENDNRDDGARNEHDGSPWQQGGWGAWGRRGMFQDRNDGLNDAQADALSDAFQDCVASDELREMRRPQLWNLISTIGLTEHDRQHIRSRRDLSDALSDHLDSNDVQDLKVTQIFRVARACGLSIWDVLAIIHED